MPFHFLLLFSPHHLTSVLHTVLMPILPPVNHTFTTIKRLPLSSRFYCGRSQRRKASDELRKEVTSCVFFTLRALFPFSEKQKH